MTTTLQIGLTWQDEFIKWDNETYSNEIGFRSHEIWVPNLIPGNNLNNFKTDSSSKGYELDLNFLEIFDLKERDKYLININANGECRWNYPLKLMTVCQLDQEYFPFDFHECYIDFRSSAYLTNQVKMVTNINNGISLKLLKESEFDLIKATSENLLQVEKHQSSNSMSIVRITLLIKRKMVFYTNKIILPYFVFYIATLFTYLLPVETGEKKSLSTSILISSFYFFKDCISFVSKTSFLSLLSIYFNLNLIFVFICIIFTTFIYLIYYMTMYYKPVPKLLAKILDKNKTEDEKYSISQEETIKMNFSILKRESFNEIKQKNIYSQFKQSIKNELVLVNNQLLNLRKNVLLQTCNEKTKALETEKYLGYKHLGILRKFKQIIVAQTNQQVMGCKKPKNFEHISKCVNSNRKCLKTLGFMNTLESLKVDMFRLNKRKSKRKSNSLNKLNSGTKFKYEESTQFQSIDNFFHNYMNSSSNKFLDYIKYLDEKQNEIRKANSFLEVIKQYKSQIKTHVDILNLKVKRHGSYESTLNIHDYYTKTSDNRHSHQWKFLAISIDRKLFYIFLMITTISVLILYSKAVFYI